MKSPQMHAQDCPSVTFILFIKTKMSSEEGQETSSVGSSSTPLGAATGLNAALTSGWKPETPEPQDSDETRGKTLAGASLQELLW